MIIAPLMLFALPGGGLRGVAGRGLRWYVALLLAVPSGVGVLPGDGCRRRRAPASRARRWRSAARSSASSSASSTTRRSPTSCRPRRCSRATGTLCPGSPLALLGVGGRTAAYYAGGQPQTLNDTQAAYNWLVGGRFGQQRCLAMKAEELPKLNQLWREHAPDPRTNLPVLDARSSQILLAASSSSRARRTTTRSAGMVLTAPPHPQRPLDVNMDDKLQVLGIDLVDERGQAHRRDRAGPHLPPQDVLQGARARHDGVGGVHPHRRLPPPPQRRSQGR